MRIFGAAFVLASVICAGAANAASAKLPEWGQCRATESGSGGKYANPGCTQQVKKIYGSYLGGYEWYPLTRSSGEISSGQQTELQSAYAHPDTPATFKFAGGREVQCRGAEEAEESTVSLDGADVVTDAPWLVFSGCEEPVLALEHHGDKPGEGELPPGECHSTDAGNLGEFNTEQEFEAGKSSPPYGTTWAGQTEFLGDKTGPVPVAGIVYKTDPRKERFFPLLTCEGGENSQPLAIQVGGHKASERLTAEITPVNTMSRAYTATLRPQATGQTEASINTGTYEAVTIEASWYLPQIYIPYEQRLAWEEAGSGPNSRYGKELELKATP